MKRRILQFFVAISLLLCVATLALWALTYRKSISLSWWRSSIYVHPNGETQGSEDGSGEFRVLFARGGAMAEGRLEPPVELNDKGQWFQPTEDHRVHNWDFHFSRVEDVYYPAPETIESGRLADWGFWFYLSWNARETRSVAIEAPFWFISILFALAPAAWLFRRRVQSSNGKCIACGYDLRATPDRCPECGTARAAE
jgi:hypothetical protein